MTRTTRLSLLFLAAVLIAGSWWGVSRLSRGLVSERLVQDGVPLWYLAPADGSRLPGVIVAHGFSGSRQLMLGYGYALARAGYAVMLPDFPGHAANAQPLVTGGAALQSALDTAYAALLARPAVDGSRISLLGHSMGSGAVMSAGIATPDHFRAVVAVSPTGAAVTADRPPNLLLQAGALEAGFVDNARGLLDAAGGLGDDFAAGRARAFELIPNVEHITILFSAVSQQGARAWLDRATGQPASVAGGPDTRMVWYSLHLLGWLLLGTALAQPSGAAAVRPGPRSWIGFVAAPAVAVGLLAGVAARTDVSGWLGMLVGGVLGAWLLAMGSVWLVASREGWIRPNLRSLLGGLALFALLWLAFGLMAQVTWLQWFINPPRLLRWPLLALACLPWKLAAGLAVRGGTVRRRATWWLVQSIWLTGGLLVTALIVPGLFFLVLVAPTVPVVLAIESVAAARLDDAWSVGIGTALFFGWLIAALFPLV